jgi:biotin/methionine sulfoxide reductase
VDAGIKFINISPSKNDAPSEVAAEWISIRPNTDLALMIGLAHTLVNEGLHDRSFLDRYCHGYHKFEDYLLGRKDGVAKDAAWASRITGLQDSSIKMLARRMASTRTLITTSWSVQRADHGEQPIWMTVVLASMLGQIGLPGGGFGLGFGATNSLAAPRPHALPRPTLPLGPNPVHRHIPVGRVTEMLLNPGSALEYNGSIIQLPEIKLVYSVGGNPFHHNTNLNRFLQAWQRPDTIIVHEPWWNPAAKHADIVLPATTTLERNDILATESSRFIVAMKRVIAPVATARNDIDIFSELADRLGIGSQYSEGRTEMGWLRHMYETARAVALERGFNPPPFDDFWALGSYEFPMPEEPVIFMGDFRRDPKANALKTPSGRIEVFSETIEGFKYDDCPPHPTWINPLEWLGSTKTKAFPLHLLTNQPKARLHSQLDPAKLSKDSKINDREPIDISRADALERDLKNGDIVRVFNDRGAFLAATSIVDHLGPGIAQISTGAWYDPHEPGTPGSLDKHGNPNVLTLDKGTSRLTQSSAAQTVLVQIERASNPPGVTAFKWPTIAAGRFE